MKIRVAHSPDADDYFLFWPIRSGRLTTAPYEFEFTTQDTEDLNNSAITEQFDVVAISAAAISTVLPRYDVLRSGASVGRSYGPKLITSGGSSETHEQILKRLNHSRIGIPGARTTAARLLKQLLPEATTEYIPLSPYRGVFDAIISGKVDAAVVIHEGQLAYEEFGCRLVEDLGLWWFRETGLPIPVGVNVIHRRLGSDIAAISAILQQSVRVALDAQHEVLPALVDIDREQGGKLRTEQEIVRYLSLYANEESYDLPPDAIRGIEKLLGISLAGKIV